VLFVLKAVIAKKPDENDLMRRRSFLLQKRQNTDAFYKKGTLPDFISGFSGKGSFCPYLSEHFLERYL
jgi:hypothetical protein